MTSPLFRIPFVGGPFSGFESRIFPKAVMEIPGIEQGEPFCYLDRFVEPEGHELPAPEYQCFVHDSGEQAVYLLSACGTQYISTELL